MTSLNTSEFLEALSKPNSGNNLASVLTSVLKDSISNTVHREVAVVNKIKVKHNAIRDAVLTFRDLTLYFNKEGIAETEAYNKEIIEIEQMYRPGCFTFVEDATIVEEDITVDQFLENARKDLEMVESKSETLEDTTAELTEIEEEITNEQTPNKRGRKGKGK